MDLCEAGGHKGLIVPVDEPYVYNRQAELEVDELCEDERGRIFRLASDITRMVQKVLRGAGATHVELATWQDLAKVTPGWMTEEITAAYRFPGAIPGRNQEPGEQYQRFVESGPSGSICRIPAMRDTCPPGGLLR